VRRRAAGYFDTLAESLDHESSAQRIVPSRSGHDLPTATDVVGR
jgi:hypothetical protein